MKKALSLFSVFVMLFVVFASGVTAFALPTPASASSVASSTVYCMPDNTSSMTIGSIGIETVSVYWAEGNSYYIQYTVSSGAYSGYKRGYVPKSKISVSGVGGINYASFPAHTSSNQTVYNRNTTSSMTIGTVYSTDNITVLQEDGTWYYIQYPITGGYKRGYVPKSTVVAAAAQPSGHLDVVNASLIGGWAWISTSPNTPIYVRITITNVVTGAKFEHTVAANQYRSDLVTAGIGNGYHGFSYGVNWNNFPNGTYSVSACGIGGSNPALSNSPRSYNLTSSTCFSNGTYRIKNVNSSKYLDVAGGGTTSGTNVIQFSLNNGTNQQWQVTGLGDGCHVIVPRHTNNEALSVYDNYKDYDNSAGNYIVIETNDYDPITGNKIRVGFQHLDSPSSLGNNDVVSKGQIIGYVGNKGSSATGYHLHLYMMREPNIWTNIGKTVNPQNFYPNISFTGSTGGPYTIG